MTNPIQRIALLVIKYNEINYKQSKHLHDNSSGMISKTIHQLIRVYQVAR